VQTNPDEQQQQQEEEVQGPIGTFSPEQPSTGGGSNGGSGSSGGKPGGKPGGGGGGGGGGHCPDIFQCSSAQEQRRGEYCPIESPQETAQREFKLRSRLHAADLESQRSKLVGALSDTLPSSAQAAMKTPTMEGGMAVDLTQLAACFATQVSLATTTSSPPLTSLRRTTPADPAAACSTGHADPTAAASVDEPSAPPADPTADDRRVRALIERIGEYDERMKKTTDDLEKYEQLAGEVALLREELRRITGAQTVRPAARHPPCAFVL
jgi:hypothetical protein